MKSINRYAILFFATLLAATFGGAAAADEEGTQYSATTPDGSGNYAEDAAMTARLKEQIFREPSLKSSNIEVTTTQGVVHLSGTAGSAAEVLTAVQFANSVAGAVSVTNDIRVQE